jgi:hypothetical protein
MKNLNISTKTILEKESFLIVLAPLLSVVAHFPSNSQSMQSTKEYY